MKIPGIKKAQFRIPRIRSKKQSIIVLLVLVFIYGLVMANLLIPVESKRVYCPEFIKARYSIVFGQGDDYNREVGISEKLSKALDCPAEQIKLHVL